MGTGHRASVVRGAAVKVVAAWIVLPLFFLATGGDLAWWSAWAYCVSVLAPMTLFMIHLARHDPDFITRRSKMREQEPVQRRILAFATPLMLAVLTVPGLDHRYGWSHPPTTAVVAALVVSLVGYLAIVRVFLENRWAGRTIETYADQQVVATGPYAFVRHPMYASSVALYVATPVALGSWWALLPAVALIPVFVVRILDEERVLADALPGYDEYRRRVRHRLVPLVW